MKGVSKDMRQDAAAGCGLSAAQRGAKRRRVMKSGADAALEDEDAEEAEDEEGIPCAESSPRTLGLLLECSTASEQVVSASDAIQSFVRRWTSTPICLSRMGTARCSPTAVDEIE